LAAEPPERHAGDTAMDPLHLIIFWTITAIVLIGIASAIDAIIAWPLGYPRRRRRVFAVLIIFLGLSVGFLAIALLVLHWAAPSTL
jgi:hypothetical protein